MESTSAVSPSMSRRVGGGPVDEAPDFNRVSRAASPKARTYKKGNDIKSIIRYERYVVRTSGNAAPFAIFCTPSTRGLRYVAATLGSRTSLTRLSITTTVRRWTSILLSLSARTRSGTSTAKAGDVTSATKVVDDNALMQAATESGSDMHLTRTGM